MLWFQRYILHVLAKLQTAEARFFPTSYFKTMRTLRKCAGALGFEQLDLTSHSLRRRGATGFICKQFPIADVMLFGRWASESSAREYLRRGEVFLTRFRADYPAAAWRRVELIGRVGSGIFLSKFSEFLRHCRVYGVCGTSLCHEF